MMGNDPTEPLPLSYLSPRDDLELHKERLGQRKRGAVFSCAIVIFAVGIFLLGSIQIHLSGLSTPSKQLMVLLWPMASLGLLVAVTAYQHFRRGRRWFVQGVLIGIGIAALIEGVCLGILR